MKQQKASKKNGQDSVSAVALGSYGQVQSNGNYVGKEKETGSKRTREDAHVDRESHAAEEMSTNQKQASRVAAAAYVSAKDILDSSSGRALSGFEPEKLETSKGDASRPLKKTKTVISEEDVLPDQEEQPIVAKRLPVAKRIKTPPDADCVKIDQVALVMKDKPDVVFHMHRFTFRVGGEERFGFALRSIPPGRLSYFHENKRVLSFAKSHPKFGKYVADEDRFPYATKKSMSRARSMAFVPVKTDLVTVVPLKTSIDRLADAGTSRTSLSTPRERVDNQTVTSLDISSSKFEGVEAWDRKFFSKIGLAAPWKDIFRVGGNHGQYTGQIHVTMACQDWTKFLQF